MDRDPMDSIVGHLVDLHVDVDKLRGPSAATVDRAHDLLVAVERLAARRGSKPPSEPPERCNDATEPDSLEPSRY